MRLIHLLLVVALFTLFAAAHAQRRRAWHSDVEDFDGDPVALPEYSDYEYERSIDTRAVRVNAPNAHFTRKNDDAKVSQDKEDDNQTTTEAKVRRRNRFQPASQRSAETTTTRSGEVTSRPSKYTRTRSFNVPKRPYSTTTQKTKNTPESQHSWRKDVTYEKKGDDARNPPRRYETRNRTRTTTTESTSSRKAQEDDSIKTNLGYSTRTEGRGRDLKNDGQNSRVPYQSVNRGSSRGRMTTTTTTELSSTTAVKFLPTTTTGRVSYTTTTTVSPSTTTRKIYTTTPTATTTIKPTTKIPVVKVSTTTVETPESPSRVAGATKVSLDKSASPSEIPRTRPSLPPSVASTRGNVATSFKSHSSSADDEEENYPEHFKQLLRQKQEKGESVNLSTEKSQRAEPTRPRFIPRERPSPTTTTATPPLGPKVKLNNGARDNVNFPLKQAKRVKILENFNPTTDNSILHTPTTTTSTLRTTTTHEEPNFVPKRSKVVVQESYSRISTQSSVERKKKPSKVNESWRTYTRRPSTTLFPVSTTTSTMAPEVVVVTLPSAKSTHNIRNNFNPFPRDFDDFGTYTHQYNGQMVTQSQQEQPSDVAEGNYVNFHLPTVTVTPTIVTSPAPSSRFSSRYRNAYRGGPASSFVSQRHGPSAAIVQHHPVYIPTIPSIRTTYSTTQLPEVAVGRIRGGRGGVIYDDEFPERDSHREPVYSSGLTNSQINVETSNHSPSVTVSIFSALADILSQTTESIEMSSSFTESPTAGDSNTVGDRKNLADTTSTFTSPVSTTTTPIPTTTTTTSTTTTSTSTTTESTTTVASGGQSTTTEQVVNMTSSPSSLVHKSDGDKNEDENEVSDVEIRYPRMPDTTTIPQDPTTTNPDVPTTLIPIRNVFTLLMSTTLPSTDTPAETNTYSLIETSTTTMTPLGTQIVDEVVLTTDLETVADLASRLGVVRTSEAQVATDEAVVTTTEQTRPTTVAREETTTTIEADKSATTTEDIMTTTQTLPSTTVQVKPTTTEQVTKTTTQPLTSTTEQVKPTTVARDEATTTTEAIKPTTSGIVIPSTEETKTLLSTTVQTRPTTVAQNNQIEVTTDQFASSTTEQAQFATIEQTTTATPKPRRRDYVVFGILPNNTVIARYPDEEEPVRQQKSSDSLIVYGIYPNNTVVRKYPNGTIVPDSTKSQVLLTDIDPKSLTDPNSDLHRLLSDPHSVTTVTNWDFTSSPQIINLLKRLNKAEEVRTKTDNIISLVPSRNAHSEDTTVLIGYSTPRPVSTTTTTTATTRRGTSTIVVTPETQTPNTYVTLDLDPVTNQVQTGIDAKLDSTIYNVKPSDPTTLSPSTTKADTTTKSVIQSLTTIRSLLDNLATELPKDRDNFIFDDDTTAPSTVGQTTKTTTVQSTTVRKDTTRRKTTTTRPPLTEQEERETLEKNLIYLQELLGLVTQPSTRRPSTEKLTTPTPSTSTTTTTTTTPSTTTTTTTPSTTTTTTTTSTTTTTPSTTSTTTSTTRKPMTTTKAPVRTTPHSDFEDLAFLNRLRQLFQVMPPARPTTRKTTKKPTTSSTTTTTPEPTTSRTHNLELLLKLNEVTATTSAPSRIPTVHTDEEDIEFLNSLRNYANIISTPRPPQGPTLAGRIVELAVNRTGKAASEYPLGILSTSPVVPTTKTTTRTTTRTTASTTSQYNDDSVQQDLQSVTKDLQLLSQLLGRPVSIADLPTLTKEIPSSTRSTQIRTSTTQATSPVVRPTDYGKTDDAILAAVLKQRGIGPMHNVVPIEELYQTRGTTQRTRLPPPTSRRPIMDGLAWLWRTWQDTAPRPNRQPSSPAAAPSPRPILQISGFQAYQTTHDNDNVDTGGIDQDAIPRPLDANYDSNSGSTGFGVGGQLLNAAIGVTQAVTQFLGVAFQGATKSFQNAFSTNPTDDRYYRLSGR